MSEWRTSSRETQLGETARFAAVSPRSSASLLSELRTSSVQPTDTPATESAATPSEGVPPAAVVSRPLAAASGSDGVPSGATIQVRRVVLEFAPFCAMLNERVMPGASGSSGATKCAGRAGLLSTLGFLGKCREQEPQHIVHTETLPDGRSNAVKLCRAILKFHTLLACRWILWSTICRHALRIECVKMQLESAVVGWKDCQCPRPACRTSGETSS